MLKHNAKINDGYKFLDSYREGTDRGIGLKKRILPFGGYPLMISPLPLACPPTGQYPQLHGLSPDRPSV